MIRMPIKALFIAGSPSPLEGDFSIVIGGPLYQALRRAPLTGDALELTRRRIVVAAIIVGLGLASVALALFVWNLMTSS